MERPGIYISLGSNIDPEPNILAAARLLTRDVDVMESSTVYESAALGTAEQPPFWNAVLRIETDMQPWTLKFEVLRPLEDELGRIRTADRNAPRTIDLDILLYGEEIIETPGLVVPDVDVLTRPFLAVPLYEIAGDIPLPGMGVRLASVALALDRGLRPLVAFTKLLKEEVQNGYRQG